MPKVLQFLEATSRFSASLSASSASSPHIRAGSHHLALGAVARQSRDGEGSFELLVGVLVAVALCMALCLCIGLSRSDTSQLSSTQDVLPSKNMAEPQDVYTRQPNVNKKLPPADSRMSVHYAREHHEIHFEKESPPPEFYNGAPFVPPNSADQGLPPNTIRDERQDINNMPTTVDLGMLVPTTSNLEERLPALLPAPKAVVFQDPRIARRREVGVVGFAARPVQPHELGRLDGPDACDAFCNASFLSLSFDVGGGGFMVPMLPKKGPFRTAEEAAQAQGMEVDWPTMFAILLAKFGEGTRLAQALLATGESFLLEHGADASGRIWHETCANRLGLQLMLIRDLLAPQKRREPDPNDPDVDLMTWTEFAKDICKFDIFSGEQEPAGMSSWQRAVKAATSKVLLHILAEVNRRSISSTSLED